MRELQELIRRIKQQAAGNMIVCGDVREAWEDEQNGAIGFCRELCDEIDLDGILDSVQPFPI